MKAISLIVHLIHKKNIVHAYLWLGYIYETRESMGLEKCMLDTATGACYNFLPLKTF